MSEPQARHPSSDVANGDDDSAAAHRYGFARPKITGTVRFWGLPILVSLAVLSALAAFYLGGILQPMTNLRHFPVAILNEDAGPTGAQVVKGMQASFDNDAYDVRVLNHDQAKTQLVSAQAAARRTELELDRQIALVARDASSRQLLEQAQANRETGHGCGIFFLPAGKCRTGP